MKPLFFILNQKLRVNINTKCVERGVVEGIHDGSSDGMFTKAVLYIAVLF